MPTSAHDLPLQSLLHDGVCTFKAPFQAWSRHDGNMTRPADGVFVGDTRIISARELRVADRHPEHLDSAIVGGSQAVFSGAVRYLDTSGADPRVVVRTRRSVSESGFRERITIHNGLAEALETELCVNLHVSLDTMSAIKAGNSPTDDPGITLAGGASCEVSGAGITAKITAEGAEAEHSGGEVSFVWKVKVPAHSSLTSEWEIVLVDSELPVGPAGITANLSFRPQVADARAIRWLEQAEPDLENLLMTVRAEPELPFFAAGAPWFFTLFGRDSLWAARLVLPATWRVAATTLAVLAKFQGTRNNPDTAEQPGKIMHELRFEDFNIPGEGVRLPPLYYGTIDATPLWISTLFDAHKAGMPLSDVEALLPNLRRALDWIVNDADSDGDTFLEYIDESGHGLANQGWKDSGDSIQWNSGDLAEGPIALCEVQAYAYEALLKGASLLEKFDGDGEAYRARAEEIKANFHAQFWVEDEVGPYPAIALDKSKRPVDSLTSNIGHLLGTGILTHEEEGIVAERLIGEDMNSGFGLRTLSTTAGGYWPLSYHGGSVWTHDTAIAIVGLMRAGFEHHAKTLIDSLLRAAEAFEYRLPELFSGDGSLSHPLPYPASCRPQAWAAASAIAVADCLARIEAAEN